MAASVVSSAARAASTRWASSQLEDRDAGLGGEAAGEGALGDVGVGGELATVRGSWRRSSAQARVAASEPPAWSGSGCSTYWAWPPSRWGGTTMRRATAARERGAVVAAEDVQAEVEARGDAGRGQHVALVDVEHVGLDAHARVAGGEVGGVAPVGGRAAAVEHAGGGQRERAGADRDHARAAGVRGAQRVEHRLGGHAQVGREARDEHRVGVDERLEAGLGDDVKPAVVGTGPARPRRP